MFDSLAIGIHVTVGLSILSIQMAKGFRICQEFYKENSHLILILFFCAAEYSEKNLENPRTKLYLITR